MHHRDMIGTKMALLRQSCRAMRLLAIAGVLMYCFASTDAFQIHAGEKKRHVSRVCFHEFR